MFADSTSQDERGHGMIRDAFARPGALSDYGLLSGIAPGNCLMCPDACSCYCVHRLCQKRCIYARRMYPCIVGDRKECGVGAGPNLGVCAGSDSLDVLHVSPRLSLISFRECKARRLRRRSAIMRQRIGSDCQEGRERCESMYSESANRYVCNAI